MNNDARQEPKDEDALLISTEQQKIASFKPFTLMDRLRILVNPIKSKEMKSNAGDMEAHYVLIPDTFRMWFYLGFIIFAAISITVTLIWADTDLNDNAITERFGYPILCVFFDDPPMTNISSILWIPLLVSFLLYSYFDYFRVYDAYMDNKNKKITKTFYVLYTAASIFEALSIVCFVQTTATQPNENMYTHIIPYLILLYSFWVMALTDFIYFYKIGLFNELGPVYHCLGYCYVAWLILSGSIHSFIDLPNLFHAYLWKQPGLQWTSTFCFVNHYTWLFGVFICPILINMIVGPHLRTVKVIMNRSTNPKSVQEI